VKETSKATLPPAVMAERERLIHKPYKRQWWPLLEKLCNNTAIWHQLSRHSPVITRAQLTGEWWSSEDALDEKWSDSDVAVRLAFRSAFLLANSNMQTRTAAEEREAIDFHRKKAKQFQEEASLLAEISEDAAEHARALAEWYEFISSGTDTRLVVGRHQRSPRVRAVRWYHTPSIRRRSLRNSCKHRRRSIRSGRFKRERRIMV
jgi:hypothetical protein